MKQKDDSAKRATLGKLSGRKRQTTRLAGSAHL